MVLQPKVSVIIPVYNTAGYLESALMSVSEQTLEEIEIIIINDGSTDSSGQIIDEFQIKDCRVKYYYQTNQGQSVARNTGLDKATGEYVYFMDSDDILEKMHSKFVIKDPKQIILTSDFLMQMFFLRTAVHCNGIIYAQER